MKLKLFITMGILSLLPYLRGQDVSPSTNPPVQMAPRETGTYVNHFGVGAQLGEPFGVNAKYWVNDCMALDAAAGWSPAGHSAAEIHGDFLVHDFDLLKPSQGRLPVYFGAGMLARFRTDNRGNLGGFRLPLGVSYMFENSPVDVFAEIAPEIIVAPFTRGGFGGAVGVRFWF